jgi:hypothetical protein
LPSHHDVLSWVTLPGSQDILPEFLCLTFFGLNLGRLLHERI